MRRRPKRSPSVPARSNRPANTRVYASTTHWSSLMFAPRSRTSVGQRDVDDRVVDHDDERLTHSTTSASQRRRSGVVGAEIAEEFTRTSVPALMMRSARRGCESTGRNAVAAVTNNAPLEPNTVYWLSTSIPLAVVIAQPSAHSALSVGTHEEREAADPLAQHERPERSRSQARRSRPGRRGRPCSVP